MLLNCGVGEDSLRVPWTARRSNQSILKEISPEYSLEGLMLKLKLQSLSTWCEELTHWKRPWCWERLKAWGEEEDRGWDGWMASPTQWTWVWVSSGSWWWTGRPGVVQSMGWQRVEHDWVTELTDWLTSSISCKWNNTVCILCILLCLTCFFLNIMSLRVIHVVAWNDSCLSIPLYEWASLMVQQVKSPPEIQETQETWVGKIPWRRKW